MLIEIKKLQYPEMVHMSTRCLHKSKLIVFRLERICLIFADSRNESFFEMKYVYLWRFRVIFDHIRSPPNSNYRKQFFREIKTGRNSND